MGVDGSLWSGSLRIVEDGSGWIGVEDGSGWIGVSWIIEEWMDRSFTKRKFHGAQFQEHTRTPHEI